MINAQDIVPIVSFLVFAVLDLRFMVSITLVCNEGYEVEDRSTYD